jgi:hypothetical protein
MFQFADSIGGHSFCIFFLNLDLFDCDELGWVGAEMAKVDVCIGTFSELFAWGRLAGSIRNAERFNL